ncbi:unnamed protein product [Trichogramma brassicae]|uniref:Uncharacterized protein n=1 Tax=Trichogramma brassicae TaxID=86971 RepID=A0A6H5HXX6_9HYME|nr:unnamed protein product [Trichogramma brassicae]
MSNSGGDAAMCDTQQTALKKGIRQSTMASCRIGDTAVMAKILGGLPEKYGAFIVAWDSVETNRQTLSTLKERLLKEEKRLSVDSARHIEAFFIDDDWKFKTTTANGNNHVSDGRLRTHKNNNQREVSILSSQGPLGARSCLKKANDRERAQRQQKQTRE